MTKTFFAGLEEIISRVIGLILSIVFFIIYVWARPNQTVSYDWYSLAGNLLIFWLIYEFISYILFMIFVYFSKQNAMISNQSKTSETNVTENISE